MANSITYKKDTLHIGDTLDITYKFKDGEKERSQAFKGILMKIKGKDDENRMITVRKISKVGIGVERIIPLFSPNIVAIKISRLSSYKKSRLNFIRNLTETQVKRKLYRTK